MSNATAESLVSLLSAFDHLSSLMINYCGAETLSVLV